MTEPVQIAITSAVATLLISWGSVWFTNRLQQTREFRLRERETRLRSYAALAAHRLLIAQQYVSRFEALIHSDYHETRWALAGHPPGSIDFQEAVRWMHKSEDLAIEVARTSRELFDAVAIARSVFPQSDELTTLAEAVQRHAVPSVKVRPTSTMSADELDVWKTRAVSEVQQVVREGIERPIEQLIDHLAPRIRSDRHWWEAG